MNVFLTGATGYIGFNVAVALRRAGHRVYGLVRSEDKVKTLLQHEIIPVQGTLQEPEGYRKVAADCAVLIHAAADLKADMFALEQQTIRVLLELASIKAQPKTFIYTSGVWVYGSTGPSVADETTPLNPARLVAPRPDLEQLVLNAKGVRSLVVRPGCVYGKQGGLTGLWFQETAPKRVLTMVGDGKNHWAMVHVDDLADGYCRAAESDISGEIFNLVDPSHHRVADMVQAVGRAAGYKGEIRAIPINDAVQTMGDFAQCLAFDQRISGEKAQRLLGWQPRHPSFVEGAETYYAAWKAYQK
jgi:nucleoside-diphosphate-sugar epimerase